MSYLSGMQNFTKLFNKVSLDDAFELISRRSISSPYFKLNNDRYESIKINLELRSYFVEEFSWAIPTHDVIKKIHDITVGKKILEVGAGNGLWAKLLKMSGSEIIAIDSFESHGFAEDNTYLPVHNLEAVAAIEQNRDCDVLMLIWPAYDTDMAERSIKAFKGSTVIYIGEGYGGCNANDEFFDELCKNWEECRFDDNIYVPSWYGIHDSLEIHQRK
jgi:hypothetical protein